MCRMNTCVWAGRWLDRLVPGYAFKVALSSFHLCGVPEFIFRNR